MCLNVSMDHYIRDHVRSMDASQGHVQDPARSAKAIPAFSQNHKVI